MSLSLKNVKQFLVHQVNNLLKATNFNLVPKNQTQAIRKVLNLFIPHISEFQLIRIGGEYDGGYLLPDDLTGIKKCISPGCDNKIMFEKELYEKHQIPSLILDKATQLPKNLIPGLEFIPKLLGPVSNQSYITLEEIIANEAAEDLLLQMDIEGAEYLILAFTPEKIIERFRIIVIEFHDLSRLVSSNDFLDLVESCIQKLLKSHYIAHFHENTSTALFKSGGDTFPTVAEVTLHRRDRVLKLVPTSEIRHELDFPNDEIETSVSKKFTFNFTVDA